MLGVALGTGGVGAIAGVKLAMAVGEKLMTNKKVADLAGKVNAKALDYMKNELHIPVDRIVDATNKVKEKTQKVTGNKVFKWVALGTAALLAGGVGLDQLLNHGQLTSAAHEFASNGTHDAMKHMGFDSGTPDVTGAAPTSGTVPSPGGVSDGTIPAPTDAATPTGTIPAPSDAVTPDGTIPAPADSTAPAVTGSAPDVSGSAAAGVAGGATEHVVAKNESLWKIAHKALGEHASDHDIAKGVQSLIDANPQIHNPDLIFPGDVVKIPAGLAPDLGVTQLADVKQALTAAINPGMMNPLDPLGGAHLSFPVSDAAIPVGEVAHAATDSVTKVATTGIDVESLKSAIKPVSLDPLAIQPTASFPTPGFEVSEIKPNAGAVAKFAEMAKAAEVKHVTKPLQFDLG
jgi:nucleoid-associated protein YgaU